MELPVYKLVIDESDELGVSYIALVDKPAIEKNWFAFMDESEKQFKFYADKERRLISGVLMISDLPIYRKDEMGEYYVVFDKEQIEKIAQRFFKKGYTHNVNMMHDSERQVNGVYMVESFIIDKTRGIKTPEGYPTLTEGSWFGTFKVDIYDGKMMWKYFIKKLNFTNYKSYLNTLSNRNNYDDIIRFLDNQTGKSIKNYVKQPFFNYQYSSSIDPTGSYLAPYITTVGLYSGCDLVAVAKLAQPIKNTGEIPINISVKWDT